MIQQEHALMTGEPLLTPLRPEEVQDPRARRIMERWRDRVYDETSFVGLLAHSPEMLKAFVQFAKVFYGGGETSTIGLPLKEMIRLRSAKLTGCRH